MKEYESFERIGVEPHRSYYIPFAPNDKIKNKFGIIDRRSSSRFVSLDGVRLVIVNTTTMQYLGNTLLYYIILYMKKHPSTFYCKRVVLR